MPPQRRSSNGTGGGSSTGNGRTWRHPAHDGGPFTTGSAVIEYLQRVQGHEARAANAMREQAQRIYHQIRTTGKMPGGIDKMLVARRQRRAWLRMAAWMEGAGKQAAYCQALWHGDFAAAQQGKRRDLDPTK